MTVVGSQEPRGSLQIPSALREAVLREGPSYPLTSWLPGTLGGRWHGPHSTGEETSSERSILHRHTMSEGARTLKPPFLLCLGPLHMLLPLPGMPFSASSLGRFSPWRLPTQVISSRKTSLSSQAPDPLRLSFVEPITVMTSSAEGVYSQSVPSTNPGAPAGRWPHPPHSFCVQHPAWVQGTMELSTSWPNQWLNNL